MPRDYEKQLAYGRKYRKEHPDKARTWEQRKWRKIKSDPKRLELHRLKVAEAMRLWRSKNPERDAENSKKSRLRQKALGYPAARKFYRKNRKKEIARVMESRKRLGYDYKKTHPGWIQKYVRTPKGRYNGLKTSSKARGIACEIGREDFFKLIARPCHYCGISLKSFSGSGLDRINNKKGYFIGNVLPCCGDCNVIRSNKLTSAEMVVAMQAVVKLRKNRGANVRIGRVT